MRNHAQARWTGVPVVAALGALLLVLPGAAPARADGMVRVTGEIIEYEFETLESGDQVEAVWSIDNVGTRTVRLDGSLEVVDGADTVLAHALVLEYGRVDADGEPRDWRPADTLLGSDDLSEVWGVDVIQLAPGEGTDVAVRLTLPDAGPVLAQPGRQRITADFVVRYLGEGTADGGDGGSSDGLAITGAGPARLALGGAALLALGLWLASRRRRDGAGPDRVDDAPRPTT